MVSGEPGVGKSRLARQAAAYAEQKRRAGAMGPVLGAWGRAALLALGSGLAAPDRRRRGRRALGLARVRRSGDRADRAGSARAGRRPARAAERLAGPARKGQVSPVRFGRLVPAPGRRDAAFAHHPRRPARRRSDLAYDARRRFAANPHHAGDDRRHLPRGRGQASARARRAHHRGRARGSGAAVARAWRNRHRRVRRAHLGRAGGQFARPPAARHDRGQSVLPA